MIECRETNLERNYILIPVYEITCPFCKSRTLFEIELVRSCHNLFCNFCRQKLELNK